MRKRVYTQLIKQHFAENRQMLFLMGPRQVGKTTVSKDLLRHYSVGTYINWDDNDDKRLILSGPHAVAEKAKLFNQRKSKALIIFDEIHKYNNWKNFLKGFFDKYEEDAHILITGSSRLDVYRRSGDSLMGRYFILRMHPFTVGEVVKPHFGQKIISSPKSVSSAHLENMLKFSGFPEPYTKSSRQFYSRWNSLRKALLFREDLRELTQVQELSQMELLAEILRNYAGQQGNYSSLSKSVGVSVNTIKRWINILRSFYYCFEVRPWSKNVTRSLLKEPKFYLWDWSWVKDNGARLENFVASHLLKNVHMWTDLGLGDFQLHYLRDKNQREVDFLVSRDSKPWFVVEVKTSVSKPLSPALTYYKDMLNVPYAFQLVFDEPFLDNDCFSKKGIFKVSALTFLSQLQ